MIYKITKNKKLGSRIGVFLQFLTALLKISEMFLFKRMASVNLMQIQIFDMIHTQKKIHIFDNSIYIFLFYPAMNELNDLNMTTNLINKTFYANLNL